MDPCRPAVVLSYILASIAAIMSALCYTEFSVDMPVAGGAFVYVDIVLGEFLGWLAPPFSPCQPFFSCSYPHTSLDRHTGPPTG